MPRNRRVSAPGMPFHVTARVQNREPLFSGHEATILRCIEQCVQRTDVRLCAYAVMSNHLHLVVIQGRRPLGVFMHLVLRRISMAMLRTYGRVGHIFQGPYFSVACSDPMYFRNAVAYVHLNGVRAGVCDRSEDYEWTSHGRYCGLLARGAETPVEVSMQHALRVFGSSSTTSLHHCLGEYHEFLRYRLELDRAASSETGLVRPGPDCIAGDGYWYRVLVPSPIREAMPVRPVRRLDLTQIARIAIDELAPGLPLDLVRSRSRVRTVVQVRHATIIRALLEEYTPTQVARFLRITSSAVSQASAPLRRSA